MEERAPEPSLLVLLGVAIGLTPLIFGSMPVIGWWTILGGVMLLLATWLLLASFRAQLRAKNGLRIGSKTRNLVTWGPYKYTRNPIYFSFLIIQVAIGFGIGLWSVIITSALSWFLLDKFVVRHEEEYLESKFFEYPAYVEKVRRWL